MSSFVVKKAKGILRCAFKRPKIAKENIRDFDLLRSIWKPEGRHAVILRWMMTEWCNYNCPYCPQQHDRNRTVGSYQVHAFDNYSSDEWIRVIDKYFSSCRVALTITGGEPMLDFKNMKEFLKAVLDKPHIDNIRVDTNLSWNPSLLSGLPNKEKITFMCTFHPTQTTIERMLDHLLRLREVGFQVGIVNYVMTTEQAKQYKKMMERFKKHVFPLHPNPLWGSVHQKR